AVCFTLCGYHLVAGRDWYYMLPSAVFLPLLLGLAARRTEHFVLFAGTACGALFHAGNAQQWAYCTMFFVFVALSTYALREIVRALLLALAVAAPLLVPQLSLVYGLPRVLFGSGDVLRGWHAMVLPFDLLPAPHPMAALWGQTRLLDAAPLYGAGALLPVAALASGVAWLVAKIHARHPFPLATLLAMALALGNHGALWPLLQRLPVFGAFQLPYKLLGVFAALACIAGALTLDRWLGVRGRGAAFAFCAAATLYPCFHALPTNRAWPDADYPKLGLRPDARFVPDAPRRATEPRPAIALAQNLPSFYGLDSALGYDPFVEAMPETRHALQQLTERTPEALRAYGIRYVLKRRVPLAPASDEWPSIPLALPALRELAHDERSVLLEVQDPAPLASTERGPLPSTALVIDGQGITASVPESDHPQTLTLNFLHRARFVASAGTVTHDAWGRMVVRVPPHTTKLALRYRPPFWLGFVVAAAALAACLALGADPRLRRLR
ncbi:MAG TPA: hypothetical protein VI299_15375, partial [Polyangiales bacterium]